MVPGWQPSLIALQMWKIPSWPGDAIIFLPNKSLWTEIHRQGCIQKVTRKSQSTRASSFTSVQKPVKFNLGNFVLPQKFWSGSECGIFHLCPVLSLISCSPIQSCHYGTLPSPSPGSSPSSSSSSSQSSLDPSLSLPFSSFFPIFQRGKLMLHCHSNYHVCCVIYQN